MLKITDEKTNLKFNSIIKKYIDSNFVIPREVLIEKQWLSVPVESASHFDQSDINNICNAIRNKKIGECYAILAEPLEGLSNYTLEVDEFDFNDFNKECGHHCYILIDQDESFVILCTPYDYFVVAGDLPFVEYSIGSSLSEGKSQFVDFVNLRREVEKKRLKFKFGIA